jgi:hypothetical protein
MPWSRLKGGGRLSALQNNHIRTADVAEIAEAKIVLATRSPPNPVRRVVWPNERLHGLKPSPPVRGIPLIESWTAPVSGPRSTRAYGGAIGSIKHVAPPIINLGDCSARGDKGNPKRHFKQHVSGPAMRASIILVVANDENRVGVEAARN